MNIFSQRLQLKGINMTEGKQGLSFLSKRQKWFSWSFSLFVFLICICTRKLDSLLKHKTICIPSSKSLNSVCQENKNIQFTKFTDKLFSKHMEEPVIKNKNQFLYLSIIASKSISHTHK